MIEALQKFKQLQMIIRSAQYDLKGDAITKVASLILWFDSLEERFKEKPKEIKIEPLEKPIAKPIRKKASKE